MSSLIRWIKRLETKLGSSVTLATAAATVTYDQATYSGGAIVSNVGATGAVTFSLPPATVGMRVTAIVKSAFELRLDPSGTQTIALPTTGVQGAAGKYLTGNTVGASVSLICIVAGTWDHVRGANGTWTAEA